MTEPSLHSLKETIHGLSESFTYTRADGEGMSRMREMRMSTSCFRAVKECGWHCPLSTEEQVYPFIHHHHHQRIHTHTAHSLFTENIWTQLPARQRGEQQFLLPLEFGGGRTNRTVIYTRERKRNSPRFLRTAVSRTWVSLSLMRDREKDHQHHWAISRCMCMTESYLLHVFAPLFSGEDELGARRL